MKRTLTYYPVAGALRIVEGANNNLYYLLKDHLGSASVVTDSTGAIVGNQRYYPYGETRFTTGTMYTDKLYTGQREMAGLGIYHYNARFYSPKLGRFLSADTIVPSYTNPQHLNRYMYVVGNPLRYNDPTGHMEYEDPYESSDGTCDPGDASCNWVGGGSGGGGNGGGGNNGGTPNPSAGEPEDSTLSSNCGAGDMVDCPMPITAPACQWNVPCIDLTNVYLHPTDHLFPPLIGNTFIYAADGTVIGYQEYYYVPDQYIGFDKDAANSFDTWVGLIASAGTYALDKIGEKLIGASLCPACGPSLLVYTAADATNQSLLYSGRLEIGPVIHIVQGVPTSLPSIFPPVP